MTVSPELTQRIEKGSALFQYLAALSANLGITCSEMHYGWTSPSMPILRSGNYTFTITDEEESWLVVAPLLGAIVGAFITGFIADIFGRKKLIVFSSLPFIASWLMIAWATSSTVMFVARFMAGMMDGLSFTAVPMYLGEIADPKIRGLIASVCPVYVIVGILLINVFGSYLSIATTAFVSAVVPLLLLFTFVWLPESPYFYFMKERVDEARKSLQTFRGTEDVSVELERIYEAVQEQNKNRGKCMDLFTVRSNRKAVMIAFGLRAVQQLTGISVIMFYCKTIFTESTDVISPSVATIIYFSVQLVLCALASVVVDFSGRRPLLITSVTGTAFALFLNGTYIYIKDFTDIDTSSFNFVPLVALLCFVVMFSVGLQTIPLLIISEVFPTNVKAFALCAVDIYVSTLVTIISELFDWSNAQYGMCVPFFAFGVCCVLGLVFIVCCIPETKGKTLEDIQNELKGEKCYVL